MAKSETMHHCSQAHSLGVSLGLGPSMFGEALQGFWEIQASLRSIVTIGAADYSKVLQAVISTKIYDATRLVD